MELDQLYFDSDTPGECSEPGYSGGDFALPGNGPHADFSLEGLMLFSNTNGLCTQKLVTVGNITKL